jgi:hypothetical protein
MIIRNKFYTPKFRVLQEQGDVQLRAICSTSQTSNLSSIKLISDLTRRGQIASFELTKHKLKTFEWIISKIHSKLGGYTH